MGPVGPTQLGDVTFYSFYLLRLSNLVPGKCILIIFTKYLKPDRE
jgi:hypothetical protein